MISQDILSRSFLLPSGESVWIAIAFAVSTGLLNAPGNDSIMAFILPLRAYASLACLGH